MNTYTTFELDWDLQVRWYGGKTFNIYQELEGCNGLFEVDCFTDMGVETLEDAKETVQNWYTDLVACGENEEYL